MNASTIATTSRSALPADVRILVVDDSADAANGVKELLEAEGHTVGVAHSGSEALNIAMMMDPDIAFVDLRLKGEWGLDIVQSLREQYPDIVPVVMTGESDSAVVISALRQGVYDYVTKPYEPEQLLSIVERGAEKVRLQSERRTMLKELGEAKTRAEVASRSKTEFLNRLGTEFSGQLNAVMRAASAISSQEFGPVGIHSYVEHARAISADCRRMSKMMIWIAELGQLEAGTMKVTHNPFQLEDVVKGVTSIFQEAMMKKQLHLNVEIAPDMPAIRSDCDHFARILGHLMSNAVKFSTSSGMITISALFDGFGDLRLTISDQGSGIPEKDQAIAMAPFGRLAGAPAGGHSLGLGLPLAEKLTQLLGGSLKISGSNGVGTRVELRFPRSAIA